MKVSPPTTGVGAKHKRKKICGWEFSLLICNHVEDARIHGNVDHLRQLAAG